MRIAKGNWKCSTCGEVFRTRRECQQHARDEHYHGEKCIAWNKGLTAKTDPRVNACVEKMKDGYRSGRLKGSFAGKHLSATHKQKISSSMKKAHAEGRAHNIGECRWNNEPSWPEKWFM